MFDGTVVEARAIDSSAESSAETAISEAEGTIGLGGGDLGQINHEWRTELNVATTADCWKASSQIVSEVNFTLDRERVVTLRAVATGDGAVPFYTVTNVINGTRPIDLQPAASDTGPTVPTTFDVTERVTLPAGEYEYRITGGHEDFDFSPGGIFFVSDLVSTLTFTDPVVTQPPPTPPGGSGLKVTGKAKPYVGFPRSLECSKRRAVLRLKQPRRKPRATKAVVKVGSKKVATIKAPRRNQKVVVKRLKPTAKTKLTVQITRKKGKRLSASRSYTPCR